MNKAEKFIKKGFDKGMNEYEVADLVRKKFPKCVRVFQDVEPDHFPPEYQNAFKKYYGSTRSR